MLEDHIKVRNRFKTLIVFKNLVESDNNPKENSLFLRICIDSKL